MSGRRAAFLDRDGVLNERPPAHEYVTDSAALRVLPGAAEGAAALATAGYALVVVSNQRGVSRGLVSRATLDEIEALLQDALAPAGASIEAFYYCPHGLDEGCGCRKPAPGLLLRAAAERGLDLAASILVGDTESDAAAARAAGVRPVLLDERVPDLAAAARFLLDQDAGDAARSNSRS